MTSSASARPADRLAHPPRGGQPPACDGTLPRRLCEAIRRHTSHPEWANDPALAHIVWHESSNDPCAVNPGHHGWCSYAGARACGNFMLNPCRCFPNIVAQARCGVRYIEGRYGTPARAWSFWQRHGWY